MPTYVPSNRIVEHRKRAGEELVISEALENSATFNHGLHVNLRNFAIAEISEYRAIWPSNGLNNSRKISGDHKTHLP